MKYIKQFKLVESYEVKLEIGNILVNQSKFSTSERKDLDEICSIWEYDDVWEKELWNNIGNFEIHLRKYSPAIPMYIVHVGRWTGDGNWANEKNMMYYNFTTDWNEFVEMVEKLVKEMRNDNIRKYDRPEREMIDYYTPEKLYNHRGKISGTKFGF